MARDFSVLEAALEKLATQLETLKAIDSQLDFAQQAVQAAEANLEQKQVVEQETGGSYSEAEDDLERLLAEFIEEAASMEIIATDPQDDAPDAVEIELPIEDGVEATITTDSVTAD